LTYKGANEAIVVNEYGALESNQLTDFCESKRLNFNLVENQFTNENQNNTVLSKFSLSNLSSSRAAQTVKQSPLQKSDSPA
jgi:hypothetical protein